MRAATAGTMNKVESFYDANVEGEWNRLERHRLEYGSTCRLLDRFLPKNARVLDVGGGPGRYSFRLAAAGHEVTLYDLSTGSIAFAREHARTSGVELNAFVQGNVLDLLSHGLGQFDAVLCMGPLYHLLEEEERKSAIHQCVGSLAAGGVLFVSFISAFAPLMETMRNRPAEITSIKDRLLSYLSNGRMSMPEGDGGFTDAFFFRPDAIGPFMAQFPLEPLLLTAIEGLAHQSENGINALGPDVLEAALDVVERTGTDPLTWGASDHFLYVGKKK